jgi:hypothetical protein
MINEKLVAFLWKNQLFDSKDLKTTQGESIRVHDPGKENGHAGADFQEAKICIDSLDWVGSVELHVQSSDWYAHTHENDPSYENVILHVVWKNDTQIRYQNGAKIPCLALSNFVSMKQIPRFFQREKISQALPCQEQFSKVPNLQKSLMLQSCLQERLLQKVHVIRQLLLNTSNDWEETFYQSLARSYGFSVNAEPMARLAQSLPLKLILRYRDRPLGIEAALFGLAGLLEEPIRDEYQWELRREFIHLRKKHDWPSTYLQVADWKFLRMRPPNFPTVRLAQFAEVIRSNCSLISLLLEMEDLKTLESLFKISVSAYWQNHYHFGKKGNRLNGHVGNAFHSIAINTLIPMLLTYAEQKDSSRYAEKAHRWLLELKPENNFITRIFEAEGMPLSNGAESQGCLHWYREYCQANRCRECFVGKSIPP